MALTTRQKHLIEVLSERKWEWTSSKEVKRIMSRYESENYEGQEPEYQADVVYKLINYDMRAINRSYEGKLMIISNTVKGYKLATKEEYKLYSKRRWRRIKNMAKVQHQVDAKAQENGMMDILENEEIKLRFIDSIPDESKEPMQEEA